MVEFLKEAAHVVPSKRQLDWFEMERYAFVHYGVTPTRTANGARAQRTRRFLTPPRSIATSGWKR